MQLPFQQIGFCQGVAFGRCDGGLYRLETTVGLRALKAKARKVHGAAIVFALGTRSDDPQEGVVGGLRLAEGEASLTQETIDVRRGVTAVDQRLENGRGFERLSLNQAHGCEIDAVLGLKRIQSPCECECFHGCVELLSHHRLGRDLRKDAGEVRVEDEGELASLSKRVGGSVHEQVEPHHLQRHQAVMGRRRGRQSRGSLAPCFPLVRGERGRGDAREIPRKKARKGEGEHAVLILGRPPRVDTASPASRISTSFRGGFCGLLRRGVTHQLDRTGIGGFTARCAFA